MKHFIGVSAAACLVLTISTLTWASERRSDEDGLVRLATETAPSLCAACHCCNPSCTSRGGITNTPFGQMEPTYCGYGCDLKDECLWLADASFENLNRPGFFGDPFT
jgi:hypothetical protein